MIEQIEDNLEEVEHLDGTEEQVKENVLHTYPVYLAEIPEKDVPLPRWNDLVMEGDYKDMNGSPVSITSKTIDSFIKNFDEGARGQDVPVTVDHPSKGGQAAGWIKSLRIEDRVVGDKSKQVMQGLIDWNSVGAEKVQDKVYRYISSEILPKNILRAVSLVNFPAIKGMHPVELGEDGDYEHTFLTTGGENMLDVTADKSESLVTEIANSVVVQLKSLFEKETDDEVSTEEKVTESIVETEIEEDTLIKANEEGGDEGDMDNDVILTEEDVTEQMKPLREENVTLREQVDEATDRLAEVIAERQLEKLESRIEKSLVIDRNTQLSAKVGEALRTAALAEPTEYEDAVFELVEAMKDGNSVVDLGEIGTAGGDKSEGMPDRNSTAYSEMVHQRAEEIRNDKKITYKLAAKEAASELSQMAQ